MSQPVVSVHGLHKRFGDLEVLKGIDMDIDAGEVVVVFGRSGSGKSTFLRCINFLEIRARSRWPACPLPRGRRPAIDASRSARCARTAGWCSSSSTSSRR